MRCNLNSLTAAILTSTTTWTAATAGDGDWPRWRGADGTNISAETGWSVEGRSEPLWSREVGLGYASFVIKGDSLITTGYSESKGQDTIYCLDARTGAERWTYSFPAQKWDKFHGGGTQSTPVIEGDRVYTLNREGKLHCLNLVDGSVVWKKDLMSEYELEIPTWAFAASPLVLPDKVIVNVGRVLALNKDNGAPIWSTRDTGHAYSTPIVATLAGLERLVIFNGDGVVLFDPSNGREQAEYTWTTQYDVNAATPIAIGDRLFISSGYNHGCSMLQVTDQGLRPLWENKEMRNQMSGCVYYEGHLYGFDDKTLKCIDTEGNERWAQRGLGQGALMIADGKIIALSSKGELIIADASPGGYAELSRRKILDGGVYWSSPVLSNGLIFCRNSEGEIVCRDHRDAGD